MKKDSSDTFNVNIRILDLIKHLRLSQAAFGESIGVSSGRMSNIIRFRNRPDFEFLSKVLEKYPEVSSEWLMLGKGSMKKPNNFNSPNLKNINDTGNTTKEKELLIVRLEDEIVDLKNQLEESKKDKEFLKQIISEYISKNS